MPNVKFDADVFDVDQHLIVDPAVMIRLASPSGSSAAAWRVGFTGERQVFTLNDAPAGDALILRITPSRYRDIQIISRVRDDQVLPASDDRLVAPRRPSEWLPVFTSWATLSAAFDPLKQVLKTSSAFRVGRATQPDLVVERKYDEIDATDESRALAKLSLLNLYSRLAREKAPTTEAPWFDRVGELLLATRERFIAEVDETCLSVVHLLALHPQSGYNKADHSLHIKNFEEIPGVSDLSDLASVKTQETKANLQFTVTHAQRDGRRVCLLDADIDENSKLLLHTFDLIRHAFTGGTHPLDVHEALRLKFPDVVMGYIFEARALVPHVTARIVNHGAAESMRPTAAKAGARKSKRR